MADFEFYTAAYKGTKLKQGEFEQLAVRAAAVVDGKERIYTIVYPTPDNRDMAVCAVAEELHRTEQAENGEMLESVKTGSVSDTYSHVPPTEVIATADRRYLKAIRMFASVYRGARGL